MKSEADARFLRTVDGRTYFAKVRVALVRGGEVDIIDVTPGSPDRAAGEVNSTTEPEWVDGAKRGISDALTVVRERSYPAAFLPLRIELRSVIGSPLDTTPDAVRMAAFMAVWRALEIEGAEPHAVWSGGQWEMTVDG